MGFVGIPNQFSNLCANKNSQFWSAGKMHNYLMIKVDYTAPKKLLPDFLKFKLNKRGVSFLRECTDPARSAVGVQWAFSASLKLRGR